MTKKEIAEERQELLLGKDTRKRLRVSAAAEQKRIDAGQWTSGVGCSAGQMLALLDYIEELENKLFYKQVDDRLDKE